MVVPVAPSVAPCAHGRSGPCISCAIKHADNLFKAAAASYARGFAAERCGMDKAAKGWGIISTRLHPEHDTWDDGGRRSDVISQYLDVTPLTGVDNCDCWSCCRAASHQDRRRERALRNLAAYARLHVREVPSLTWPAAKFCQPCRGGPPKEGAFNKYGSEGPSSTWGYFGGPPLGAAQDAPGVFGVASAQQFDFSYRVKFGYFV